MRDITRQMRLQEWAAQVEDWKRSGLTQRQWSKAHGTTLEGFKYRKRTVEDQAEELLGSFMGPVSQIVQLPSPGEVEEYDQVQLQAPVQYCSIEINMPEGSIRVSSDIKPEVLQMLIREVKNA
jgi:hypothetical protein